MANNLVKKDDGGSESTALVYPEGWKPPTITQALLEEISKSFAPHRSGSHRFTPFICKGPECESYESCPLHIRGIEVPVGYQCIIELNLIENFVSAMASELGADNNNVFDIASVGAIAINNIVIKRALERLAREGLIVDSFRALTREGVPVFERKAHPSVHIIKEYQKLNQDVASGLMATRKEKSKDQARKRVSPSEIAEKLRQKLLAAREAVTTGEARLREHFKGEVIEADFEVKNDEANPGPGDNGSATDGEADHEEAQEEGQEVLIRDPRTGVLRKAV